MDHFLEEVVVRKSHGLQDAMYYLANVLMVLSAIIAVFMLQGLFMGFDVLTLVMVLLMAGCAVLLFLRKDRLRTEYEYTFTNGEMDFAMVFNNQKRKSLGTMRVKNVEAFGPVTSPSFQRYITMKDIKKDHWFLNRGAELYYFFFAKDGKKRIIVIEPSAEMVELIRKYLPRGVYQA